MKQAVFTACFYLYTFLYFPCNFVHVNRSTPLTDILFIVGSSLLLFFSFLGNIHLFDWDEINFAECAREMIVSKDYWHVQIDFKPFHEKPPLFIWLQVLSMKLWGINEFAARFPNAVCGLLTLLTIYRIGYKHFHRSFAMLWVLSYIGSLLPHFYFKSGIIDPWFNYFIFVSLYFLYRYFKSRTFKFIVWAGLFCGLAVFTKGPVAYLLLAMTLVIYQSMAWYRNRSFRLSFLQYLPAFLFFTVLSFSFLSLWYLVDIWRNGPALFYDFMQYQARLLLTEDAGHGGFPGYHVIVLLFGCFPASFIALQSFKHRFIFSYLRSPFARLLFVLGCVVLVVFSLVQSKIVHYSSLCYYPITFFSAVTLSQHLRSKQSLSNPLRYSLLIFLLLLGFLLSIAPFIPLDKVQPYLAKDPFAQANLDALLHWTIIPVALAILYSVILIVVFIIGKQLRWHRLFYVSVFSITVAFLHLFFWFYLPNVERISQHAAISFFQSQQGKPVYVGTYGYKSYAPLFYSQVQPDTLFNTGRREDILSTINVSKPVYLVTKVPYNNALESAGFSCIGTINGFVFLSKETAVSR